MSYVHQVTCMDSAYPYMRKIYPYILHCIYIFICVIKKIHYTYVQWIITHDYLPIPLTIAISRLDGADGRVPGGPETGGGRPTVGQWCSYHFRSQSHVVLGVKTLRYTRWTPNTNNTNTHFFRYKFK